MTFSALVVGVAEPKSPMRIGGKDVTFPALAGVEGDVEAVAHLLRGAGVAVETLTRHEETGAGDVAFEMLRRLDALAVGDTLLVYFSGHGYRVPDLNSPTGYSEMLICADGPIDDDFAARLRTRVKAGTRFIMIVDACHAAGFRLAMVPESRAPTFVQLREGPEIIWWSAALDEELATQATARDSVYSAFTMSLTEAWKSRRGTSYRELWQEVWNEFSSKFGTRGQTPVLWLEAPDERLLDETAFGAPPR
jgi:hypothetical protein